MKLSQVKRTYLFRNCIVLATIGKHEINMTNWLILSAFLTKFFTPKQKQSEPEIM